ncbi:MAG: 3'-5' exonuclease [Dermatophilaceae bacterium]
MTHWADLTYVVVEIEGNGQQPPDPVELATVPIVGGVIGEPSTWLVKPDAPITRFATHIHGLTDKHVADCPRFEDIAGNVRAALDADILVAHNAHADLGVLQHKLTNWEPPEVLDTLKLARRFMPGLDRYRLRNLVETYSLAENLPDGLDPHRATYDALVTARLFVLLANKATSQEELRGPEPGAGEDELPSLF